MLFKEIIFAAICLYLYPYAIGHINEKNYAIIIQFVLPLTTFYRSGAQRSDVYKCDMSVTSWRFHNRAWQPRRHDRLSDTSETLNPPGALNNQRCSLATECGISMSSVCRYVACANGATCLPVGLGLSCLVLLCPLFLMCHNFSIDTNNQFALCIYIIFPVRRTSQ